MRFPCSPVILTDTRRSLRSAPDRILVKSGDESRGTRGHIAPWQDLIVALNEKRSKPDAFILPVHVLSERPHLPWRVLFMIKIPEIDTLKADKMGPGVPSDLPPIITAPQSPQANGNQPRRVAQAVLGELHSCMSAPRQGERDPRAAGALLPGNAPAARGSSVLYGLVGIWGNPMKPALSPGTTRCTALNVTT